MILQAHCWPVSLSVASFTTEKPAGCWLGSWLWVLGIGCSLAGVRQECIQLRSTCTCPKQSSGTSDGGSTQQHSIAQPARTACADGLAHFVHITHAHTLAHLVLHTASRRDGRSCRLAACGGRRRRRRPAAGWAAKRGRPQSQHHSASHSGSCSGCWLRPVWRGGAWPPWAGALGVSPPVVEQRLPMAARSVPQGRPSAKGPGVVGCNRGLRAPGRCSGAYKRFTQRIVSARAITPLDASATAAARRCRCGQAESEGVRADAANE